MGRKKGVVFDEGAPDDFDPANPYKDPVAMLEMREHLVREKWIDIETAKVLRDKVRWCYRIEGVNHYQKCRHLVQQYLDATRGVGWGKDGRHPSLHERGATCKAKETQLVSEVIFVEMENKIVVALLFAFGFAGFIGCPKVEVEAE